MSGDRRRRIAVVSLLVVLMVGGAVHASEGDDVRYKALVEGAVKARKAGELDKAASMLQQAIDINPAPNMLHNLGKVLEELGRYGEAVQIYQRVADDPDAVEMLRRLDTKSVELLQARLDKAWLALDGLEEGATVRVNGALVAVAPEIGVAPGLVTLEITSADQRRTQVVFSANEAGRRTRVPVDLSPEPAALGRIGWPSAETPPAAVRVNGYTLGADLSSLTAIHLAPGRYVVELDQPGRTPASRALGVTAGSTSDLSEALATAPAATGSGSGSGSGHALAPWITMGAGAAAAGVGVGFLLGAESDRQRVRDEGPQGSETLLQRDAYDLQDAADRSATTGAVLCGVGLAAMVGGLTWSLLGGDEDREQGVSVRFAPTPGGLVMGGSF